LGLTLFLLEVGDAGWIEALLRQGPSALHYFPLLPYAGVLVGTVFDFNVYSLGKKKEKLNYMHANPVIRGLVKDPKDWPWSSWSFYRGGEAGLIRIDVDA
jgi:hypothetical protein